MNQVSFDISSERRGSAGAAGTAGNAVHVRSLSVDPAPGCVERCSVRIFGTAGLDRVSTLHETPAAALRHERYPVAA